MKCEIVSPDRIRSEDACLHYRFMRELLYPPVLDTKDTCSPEWAKKGHNVELGLKSRSVEYVNEPDSKYGMKWMKLSLTQAGCVFVKLCSTYSECPVYSPIEERDASRMAWALALSITTSSKLSRLSSDNSFLFPMSWARRQYIELSDTILMSSGKW